MVISCSALGCSKRQNSVDGNGNKVSFHRFPRKEDVCQAWLVASQRLDFVPTKYSYLCSDHFTEDQFNRTRKGFRLRQNAVPTVFQVVPKTKKRPSCCANREIRPLLYYKQSHWTVPETV